VVAFSTPNRESTSAENATGEGDFTMNRLEAICAIVMLLLSVVIIVATADLAYWDDFAPGSAFLPYWVAGAGAVLGATLLVTALRRKTDSPVDWPNRDGMRRIELTSVALWALIVALPLLGTLISVALFMLGLLLFVQRRKLVPTLITTAVTLAMIETIFVLWLRIRLPRGFLGF